MQSTLTVLTTSDGKRATKLWTRDRSGKTIVFGYDKAFWFCVETFQVSGIRELNEIYQTLLSEPNRLVIRGIPAEGVDQRQQVLRRSNPDEQGKIWFKDPDEGLCQVTLDFDNIPLPVGCDIYDDPEGAVEHVIGLLPELFWDASCIWQLSSSAGMVDDGKVSLHVSYWLNRPVTNGELKQWAKNVNEKTGFKLIDLALFQTVQPHYVARPIFDGIEDPIQRRSGFREGICDEVDFPVIIDISHALQGTAKGVLQYAKGFDSKLEYLGDGPGLLGFHIPLREAVASYAAKHGSSGTDSTVLKEKLRLAILGAPKSRDRNVSRYISDAYLNGIINSAVKKFGKWVDRRKRDFDTLPFFPSVTEPKKDALKRQKMTIGLWANNAKMSIMLHRNYEIERKKIHAEIAANEEHKNKDALTAAKGAATKKLKKKYRQKRELACGPVMKQLITGSQSSGKTSEALRQISSMSDGVIVMLLPTLEKAEEALSDYRGISALTSLPAMVLRGRGAMAVSGTQMCHRSLLAEKVAKVGLPVSSTLCRSESGATCPHFDECEYQTQLRKMEAIGKLRRGVIFASHQYAFSSSIIPDADAIIIDESLALKAGNIVSFAPDRITEAVIGWMQHSSKDNTACANTAIAVRNAIESRGPILQNLRDQKVSVDTVTDLIRLAEEASGELSSRAAPNAPDVVISVEINKIEEAEKWKIIGLLYQLRRELVQSRGQANGVTFDRNSSVDVNGKRERQARVTVHSLLPVRIGYHPLFHCSTMLFLDGTGNVELVRRVFGSGIEHHHIPMERRAEVLQLQGHYGADQIICPFATMTFSNRSMSGSSLDNISDDNNRAKVAEKRRSEIAELANGLLTDVFVCGSKRIVSSDTHNPGLLNPLLEAHCKTGHYGAIRGLNRHEQCQTAVVIGRDQPGAEKLEALARCFATNDRLPYISIRDKDSKYPYVLQCRGRRLRDNRSHAEIVEVHPDPFTQSILEQIREAEVLQAIDRVRAIFNVRRIIILTSVILDITVDMALTWTDLKALLALERRFPDVLPLRYDVIRCKAPDLIGTGGALGSERSAKGLLGRLIKSATSQIDIIRKVALYKVQGQRNPSYALILTSLSNPQMALEEFLGEAVTYFKIQPGPDVTDLIEPPVLQKPRVSGAPEGSFNIPKRFAYLHTPGRPIFFDKAFIGPAASSKLSVLKFNDEETDNSLNSKEKFKSFNTQINGRNFCFSIFLA